MRRRRRGAIATLALMLACSASSLLAADEPPAAPPAPLDQDAALARADVLHRQVVELYRQGTYPEATPLARESLGIREKALGPDHEQVAASLTYLGLLLKAQGALAEARPLHERALAIHERTLGGDHPLVARDLDRLANLLQAQGAFAEARPLYERALAVSEAALGRDHPDVATSLVNLAELLRSLGSRAEAKPLYERALVIFEKALGKDHPVVAECLNGLAWILNPQGAHAEARALGERALAIKEKTHGKDHPDVAASLNSLASLLKAQGAFAEARPLMERALEIRVQTLGPDHPDVAKCLENLADLHRAQGALAEAKPLYERVLAIREAMLGKHHPDVAKSVNSLAQLLRSQGALAEARAHFERLLALTEGYVRIQVAALNSAQRLSLVRSVRYRLDSWLRFSPRVKASGYAELLRLRGLVGRAEAAERALARRMGGEERQLLAALRAAQGLTAQLANQVPPTKPPEARASWQRRYAEAAAERERLALELSRRVAPRRVALERLDLGLADLQAHLAPDEALVDTLRTHDRYVVWVVRARGRPVRRDLGAAEAIEVACAAFLEGVAADAAEEPGAALRSLVWAPIEAALGDGVRRVVLCPDAALAAVPFAALPGRTPGRNLLDDYALRFVMYAQDLVPWKDAAPPGSGALLVGGVDYEQADTGSTESPPPDRPPLLAALDRAPRGGSFGPLPATLLEAQALRDRLGKDAATLLVGPGATEARFREAVKGRRIVHVATHGFARTDLLAGLYERKVKDAPLSADAERQLAAGHDPMLLSGLAFAGANPRDGAGGDDGVLTALEASYLDLEGVDLVTLSACETARGTAESGEGVLGLVSGFQLAGARCVLASLWKVDDEATRLLMEDVYERMLRKENPLVPGDALREAALALRAWKDPAGKARFAGPRYWAAFVAYGG